MANLEQIKQEANTYLENDITMKEAAIICKISIRTLQMHMSTLKELDPSLHKLVLEKKKSQQKQGRILGGKNGKRGASHIQLEALSIARQIIQKQLTYEKASELTGIPSSTIYDMTHRDYIPLEVIAQLDEIARANKKDAITERRVK